MSFTAPVSAALVIHPKSFSSSHIFLSHSVVADDVVVSRRRERSPSQRGNIVVSQRRERLRWTRRRRPSHAPMISPAPRSPTLQYPPPLLHFNLSFTGAADRTRTRTEFRKLRDFICCRFEHATRMCLARSSTRGSQPARPSGRGEERRGNAPLVVGALSNFLNGKCSPFSLGKNRDFWRNFVFIRQSVHDQSYQEFI